MILIKCHYGNRCNLNKMFFIKEKKREREMCEKWPNLRLHKMKIWVIFKSNIILFFLPQIDNTLSDCILCERYLLTNLKSTFLCKSYLKNDFFYNISLPSNLQIAFLKTLYIKHTASVITCTIGKDVWVSATPEHMCTKYALNLLKLSLS